MKYELKITEDGSHTIFLKHINEQYHSLNGAIQESETIYINAALKHCSKKNIKVFEIGFGTGLNALLAYIYSEKQAVNICYDTIENNPINKEIFTQLNYSKILGIKSSHLLNLHSLSWDKTHKITKTFLFQKINNSIINYNINNKYDVIFFDAFGPDIQPEVWSKNVFEKLFNSLNKGGVLTTYSVKGLIQRRLKEIGFNVENLPGPPGKREITRAIK